MNENTNCTFDYIEACKRAIDISEETEEALIEYQSSYNPWKAWGVFRFQKQIGRFVFRDKTTGEWKGFALLADSGFMFRMIKERKDLEELAKVRVTEKLADLEWSIQGIKVRVTEITDTLSKIRGESEE